MMTDNAGHRLIGPGNRKTEMLDPWYDIYASNVASTMWAEG